MNLDFETLRKLLASITSDRIGFVKQAMENTDQGAIIRRLTNTINEIFTELSYKPCSSSKISSLSDIYIGNLDLLFWETEKLRFISLDGNRIVNILTLTNENPTHVKYDYRQLFTNVLISNATSVIMIHNHPSGSYNPSEQDTQSTNLLKGLFKVFDIELQEHYIISKKGIRGILSGEEQEFDEEDISIMRDILQARAI